MRFGIRTRCSYRHWFRPDRKAKHLDTISSLTSWMSFGVGEVAIQPVGDPFVAG